MRLTWLGGLVILTLTLLAAPLAAQAQPAAGKVYRIGWPAAGKVYRIGWLLFVALSTSPSPELRPDPVSSRWLRRLRHLVGWERLTPFAIYNRLAETTTKRAGRVLYGPHVAWWNDRSWMAPYSRYLPQPRILDRRFTLVQFARAARRLEGSTAECGVFTGVSSALICKTLEGTYGPGTFHFGFDSFEGLPEPGSRDRRRDPATAVSAGAREVFRGRWRRGDLAISLETAQATLAEFAFCRLVKGWIPQSFGPAAETRFRFVHIDVDLYQTTLDSLAFFYPRLTSGGICLFDEYGLLSCPGARVAVDEFLRDKPEPIIELATGQAVLVKD